MLSQLSRPLSSRLKLVALRRQHHQPWLPAALVGLPPLPVGRSGRDSSSARRRIRAFSTTSPLQGIKSQVLNDVGEGISEVQIIQWYVEEGARIEEWSPLCQYQSDKAVDDITSRYEGVVTKLHVQADDTVETGKPLCDIEVDDGVSVENSPSPTKARQEEKAANASSSKSMQGQESSGQEGVKQQPTRHQTLATPAVRALLKQANTDILDVQGTGKHGRVLKEDVLRHLASSNEHDPKNAEATGANPAPPTPTPDPPASAPAPSPATPTPADETKTPLTPIQLQMYHRMTQSLTVPQFTYSDDIDTTPLTRLRASLASDPQLPAKLSPLPFLVKALSLALSQYPLLNARLSTDPETGKPCLTHRPRHNIGIAIDAPAGLIVPNVKDVQTKSILEIAAEIKRLTALAKASKLTPVDLAGGTFTVSNIGAIGGGCVVPVVVPGEMGILGLGRGRARPVFDEAGEVVRGEVMTVSWSADHRVVDGAMVARVAEVVRGYVERPARMLTGLR